MSEPMSNVEIEDVLSSIRRLVSDDLRPQARAARVEPAAAPVSDKLVLTPALRIVAEPAPEPAVAPGVETEPEFDAGPVFHTVRGSVAEEAGFIATDDDEPEAVLARDMPAIEAYDDDGAAAPVDMPVSIPDAVFAAEDAGVAPSLEADPWVQPASAGAQDAWAEAAEAAVRAELEQEAGQSAFARFVDEDEGPAFDEAAMRELVRDIIREELQGTLGERITRNVRKLVRAEIARALAVRDFE